MTFRAMLRGTHRGLFPLLQGIAPTGKQITISVLDVLRLEGKKLVEHWGGPDLFGIGISQCESLTVCHSDRLESTPRIRHLRSFVWP